MAGSSRFPLKGQITNHPILANRIPRPLRTGARGAVAFLEKAPPTIAIRAGLTLEIRMPRNLTSAARCPARNESIVKGPGGILRPPAAPRLIVRLPERP